MHALVSRPRSDPSFMTNPRAGDRIFLRGLQVECIIGFIEWERRIKQTIVLDIELPTDCARAAESDDVEHTVDYKRVAKRLIAFVEASDFKLVETLAHRAAMTVLEEFSLAWVRISVNKPGAISSTDSLEDRRHASCLCRRRQQRRAGAQ